MAMVVFGLRARFVMIKQRPFSRLANLEQDKTRKVLEIWTKNQTFPQATLDRLQAKLQGPTEVQAPNDNLLSSYGNIDPPPPVMSPALPPLELPQSFLLFCALSRYYCHHPTGCLLETSEYSQNSKVTESAGKRQGTGCPRRILTR